MKILYSFGGPAKTIKAEIDGLKEVGYDITPLDHREILGVEKWTHSEIYKRQKNYEMDPDLKRLYNKITELSENHDIFIVNHENPYNPKFIKNLTNIYKVIVSGDDPESSDYCSKPFVHAFDHAFAWGVMYDNNTTVAEKFLEWGASRADWWPYGVRSDMYDQGLKENDIYNETRDIDAIYVGSSWLKAERLAKLKNALSHKMQVFGRNYPPAIMGSCLGNLRKGNLYTALNIVNSGLLKTKELQNDKLIQYYRRSKIGINIHLSYGPINTRMYQLPANGVMQLCDCPEGLNRVFRIGKEVVTYHSTDEAIELINYYLENDEERKEIALAGYRRVLKDYRRVSTFSKAIDIIKSGMHAKGLRYFKDGNPISC